MKVGTKSAVRLTVSLDDLAEAVSMLSSRELEEIELAFSPAEETEILKRKGRGKKTKRRRSIELKDLQDEFG